jgi:hypothetical protein
MYIIISFISILVIIFLIFEYFSLQKLNNFNSLSIQELYDNCKTGDLLYFRWKHISLLYTPFTLFTHIGIIVEINNEKFVLEIHEKGDAIKLGVLTGGVHLHKLVDRIKYYNGSIYHSSLKKNIDKEKLDLFIKNIDNYKNINFNSNYIFFIVKNCFLQKFFNQCVIHNNQKMFCSEFILFCLYELALIDKYCNCYYPSDFTNIKSYDNEYLFDEIKKIKMNI